MSKLRFDPREARAQAALHNIPSGVAANLLYAADEAEAARAAITRADINAEQHTAAEVIDLLNARLRAKRINWEYISVAHERGSNWRASLDEYGAQGWEAWHVEIVPLNATIVVHFKRHKL